MIRSEPQRGTFPQRRKRHHRRAGERLRVGFHQAVPFQGFYFRNACRENAEPGVFAGGARLGLARAFAGRVEQVE
jgi:hypothetical protein